MSQTAQIILDKMVLVKVDATIYGARKKLKVEDLMLVDGSKLPPEDLASLGSKRLLDPDQLSVFNRLKKEAERICLRIGTRFLGGYAIPCTAAPEIITELERIALDFAAAKTGFLAGYDAAVTDWVIRHPEFADIIEKAVDSVDFVSTRFSFDYLVVTVGLPEALPLEDIVRLESKIGSLSEQMFYEIAVDASQFIEQSLLGKDQVTRSAVRPIKRMRDKLDGLGFLDYRVAPVVSTIDDLLMRIPTKGAIEGPILQEILATAMLLADSDKTRRHGEGLLAMHSMAMAVDDESDDLPESALEPSSLIVASNDSVDVAFQGEASEVNSEKSVISDLFDGIFEEDDQAGFQSESELELERDSEPVTTEDDEDEGPDSDYWF
jgi:Protein of unknown function (DUF3150)